MSLPKASDWNKHAEILNAGLKGFNALTKIPEFMKKEIPELRRFKFGFASDNEVPEWHSMGWVHLETHMFDVEEWNKSIGLRFGLTAVDGLIKYRENYIMIMDKDYRKRLETVRIDETEREFSASVEDASSYAHPEDPSFSKMKDGAGDIGGIEMARIQNRGQSTSGGIAPKDTAKKPGRPRGSKNKK